MPDLRLRDGDHSIGAIEVDTGIETLEVGERLLAKNDDLAAHVRGLARRAAITAFNLMSSPGAGKTSLLERTIGDLGGTREVCVIEGDQETAFDADRIRRAGARAVQVNTGAGCHLDAEMVHRALHALGAAGGRAALRRERRQPGLPGVLRHRRAGQGRRHLGHRG